MIYIIIQYQLFMSQKNGTYSLKLWKNNTKCKAVVYNFEKLVFKIATKAPNHKKSPKH